MEEVITACIILHNMVVEDERDNYRMNNSYLFDDAQHTVIEVSPAPPLARTIEEMRTARRALFNTDRHFQLQADLIQHLWDLHGDRLDGDANEQ